MFIFFEANNATFVSIAFLMLLAVSLVCCLIQGTIFISSNIPCITIHPILEGNTWINSFLFQLYLCLFASNSMINLFTNTFPYFFRSGDIALMAHLVPNSMELTGIFIENKVFIYCFLAFSGIGFIYVPVKIFCFSNYKPNILAQI